MSERKASDRGGSVDLLAAVLDACDRTPLAPAITLGRRTLTYGELARPGRAGSRPGLGVQPGDRVLFSVRPGIDAVVLALGIIAAGGTVVFADPGAGEALFRARAGLAAPQWVAAESVLYLASTRRCVRSRGVAASSCADYARLVPDARHVYAGRWLPGVPRGGVAAPSAAVAPDRRFGRIAVEAGDRPSRRSSACRRTRRREPRPRDAGVHHLHQRHHRPPEGRRALAGVARRGSRRLRRRASGSSGRARADRPAHGGHPGAHRRSALDHAAHGSRPRRATGAVPRPAPARRRAAVRGAGSPRRDAARARRRIPSSRRAPRHDHHRRCARAAPAARARASEASRTPASARSTA